MYAPDDEEHRAFRAEAERLYGLWLLVHTDLTEPEVIDLTEPAEPDVVTH